MRAHGTTWSLGTLLSIAVTCIGCGSDDRRIQGEPVPWQRAHVERHTATVAYTTGLSKLPRFATLQRRKHGLELTLYAPNPPETRITVSVARCARVVDPRIERGRRLVDGAARREREGGKRGNPHPPDTRRFTPSVDLRGGHCPRLPVRASG